MTATELMVFELNDVGNQLNRVFEGMPASVQDHKVCEKGMTPKETLEHLCECYQAFLTESQGGSHEWGSFSIADKSWDSLMEQFTSMRERAVRIVKASEETRILRSAFSYMVAHDAYHVGQLSACRIDADASWDPYSIYK